MLFFNKSRAKFKNSSDVSSSFFWNTSDNTTDNTGISAYITCLKILSETVGKMPLHLYKKNENGKEIDIENEYNSFLDRPNPYETPYSFWSSMEYNRNHYGNAYAYIDRSKYGEVKLWILDPTATEVLIDSKGIFGKDNALYYKYNDYAGGKVYNFSSEDIIHLKFFNKTDSTGLIGKPAKDVIKDTFSNVKKGDRLIGNLYDNGLHGKTVLSYEGVINKTNENSITKLYIDTTKGVENAGKTITLPKDFKLTTLENNSLADAQFLEINKFNTLQIASVFGITPSQLNDYSQSSFSTSEYQQLNFYVNTLQAILTMYEQELNYKILSREERKTFEFKFNINAILRGDFKTQVETLSKAINNGIMTSNEARQKLDLPKREEGDLLMCMSNYIPVDTVREKAESSLLNELNKITKGVGEDEE